MKKPRFLKCNHCVDLLIERISTAVTAGLIIAGFAIWWKHLE